MDDVGLNAGLSFRNHDASLHSHFFALHQIININSFLVNMADSLSSITTLPPFLFASALSAYGLYLCKENITRLQQYEEQSEKAAEWSNTVAQRLYKTRTTQASGSLSVRLPCPYNMLLSPDSMANNHTASPLFPSSLHPPLPHLKTHTHHPRHHRPRARRRPVYRAHTHGELLERIQTDEGPVRAEVQ
jgi:hypothetical protein